MTTTALIKAPSSLPLAHTSPHTSPHTNLLLLPPSCRWIKRPSSTPHTSPPHFLPLTCRWIKRPEVTGSLRLAECRDLVDPEDVGVPSYFIRWGVGIMAPLPRGSFITRDAPKCAKTNTGIHPHQTPTLNSHSQPCLAELGPQACGDDLKPPLIRLQAHEGVARLCGNQPAQQQVKCKRWRRSLSWGRVWPTGTSETRPPMGGGVNWNQGASSPHTNRPSHSSSYHDLPHIVSIRTSPTPHPALPPHSPHTVPRTKRTCRPSKMS